jgi:hypothetical protein
MEVVLLEGGPENAVECHRRESEVAGKGVGSGMIASMGLEGELDHAMRDSLEGERERKGERVGRGSLGRRSDAMY